MNPIPNPDPNPNQAPPAFTSVQVCVFITAREKFRLLKRSRHNCSTYYNKCVYMFITSVPMCSYYKAVPRGGVCVLLLQDLLQSCARGGRRRVEDMCYGVYNTEKKKFTRTSFVKMACAPADVPHALARHGDEILTCTWSDCP